MDYTVEGDELTVAIVDGQLVPLEDVDAELAAELGVLDYGATTHTLWHVLEERGRQDQKWGEQNHPLVDTVLTNRPGGCTPQRMAEHYGIPTAAMARRRVEMAAEDGELTFVDILLEEFAELVEAATFAQQGQQAYDGSWREAIQASAVAAALAERIDRLIDHPEPETGEDHAWHALDADD